MSQLDDADERSRSNRKRIEELERVVADLCERAGIAFRASAERAEPAPVTPAEAGDVENVCHECSGLPYHSYDFARACCAYDADSPVHDTSKRRRR